MKSKLLKSLLLLMVLAIGMQLQAQTQAPGNAIRFFAGMDYVVGYTGISENLNHFTLEAWVKNNLLENETRYYVQIPDHMGNNTIQLTQNSSTLDLCVELIDNNFYHLSANVLTEGSWMHIAGTFDGTRMNLYVNGNLVNSRTVPTGFDMINPNGSFRFSDDNSIEAVKANMEEVKLWQSVRSVSEIREGMYSLADISNPSLLNYWQFNMVYNDLTIPDSKGTATGTLYNAVYNGWNGSWAHSTIPFSAGGVNTKIVSATGTQTYTGTGLSMNFTAKSGTDTIVVSRIDNVPNVNPTGVDYVYDNQYWVINKYGTGTFASNLTFTTSEGFTTQQQETDPNLVRLYYRSGNSDGEWSLIGYASSVSASAGTATFNGITSFGGQYIICSINRPTPDIQNVPGTALDFDGTNDYVNCRNATSLNITAAITVEAWINADTWKPSSWEGTIVGKGNTNATGYEFRCGNNGKLSFAIGAAGGWNEALSGAIMQAGRWNHVAGVYDGTNISVYINGVLSGQQALSLPIGVSSQPLLIGNSPGYPTRFFDGKIDEVRIWNVARSQSQIRSTMYNTLSGTETGLADYWQFNYGSSTPSYDMVGISDGVLVNMATPTCWTESYAMVVPVPAAASGIFATGFTANWAAPAIGTVTSYKLDVSTNTTFTSLVTGYNNVDCGDNLSKAVTGLSSGTNYYYRVRADKTSVTGTGANNYTYTTVTTCIPPNISGQSTPTQTQPLNGTFTAITVTASGDNLTYQWFKNTSAVNSGGTSLGSDNGAQTYSYTPQATTIGTLYYYCVVSGCVTSQTSAISGAIIVNTVVAGITGTGTPSDPYQIADLGDLQWLQSDDARPYRAYNYIQTADINAAPCKNWNGGTGFEPIGGTLLLGGFKGTYNGKGHIVDSIYINISTPEVAGFFGKLADARIDSLNVTNVSIKGYKYCGALAGYMYNTTINHCSSSGSVSIPSCSAGGNYMGGFIGYVSTSGSSIIQYCYSSTVVNDNCTGTIYSGGLIGKHDGGTITQCYSRGLVSSAGTHFGGFVGESVHADQCYWDNQASGQTSGGTQSGSGTWNLYGKSTAEMKTQSTYVGWDFTNNWYISANANDGYPCFYYAPRLSTQAVTNIQTYTASAHGTIVDKGTPIITSYGVCYNTTGTPTTADSKVNLGTAPYLGAFTANMSGLHHGETYYVRAFAINEHETVYGTQVSFTTTNVSQPATCLYNGDQFNHISVPNNSSLQLTNNYTIEVWLKPGVAVSTNRIIVSKGYNANGYTLLSNGSGNKRGLIFDGMATADNILTQNQWCHVAAVNDNGTRHLYLNGVEMPLTGTPVSVTANTQPLYLTNYYNDASIVNNLFRGNVEEVRLWNTAMSYSQIRENMHLPLTGSETGLVSYWQFDEGQPPTVYDKKGVNNGTWYASAVNQYVSSTIPFGDGNSNTQVMNTSGVYDFTNTGISMNFTAKTGLDSIVVSKINTFPNVNPTGLTDVFDMQYWAVHKYGSGTLTANLTFTISEDLTADDQNYPTKIKLYKRSSMTDDANWVLLTSATSVDAATNTATFNGITGFSQFMLARGLCSVNIPDANFKAALVALPGLDANSDGEIQCTEATAFTGEMDVSNKSIADLTGIAAFTNITKLFCSQNSLTNLDISALTLLTDLDCSNNQLTTLDVSGNTALVNFSCGSNALTSLNVSGLTSLENLLCRFNQITSLDVSSNSSLIGLFCNNDSLTNLNVTGLTSLSIIDCAVNQLTNLDFSSNIAITKLSCSYNSLTVLNVKNGNNTNISGSYFDATINPGLSCIQVDNAAWSTTNWTHIDGGASFSTSCPEPVDIQLTIKAFPEGLFNGTKLNKARNADGFQYPGAVADQITIEMHNTTSPFALVGVPHTVYLDTNGIASATITAKLNSNYYVVIWHRNHIETWSKYPVSLSGTSDSCDFTNANTKAYGNNLKLLATGKYGVYAGDVNADGVIDGMDVNLVKNSSSVFTSGFNTNDVNGDGSVDASDLILVDNNAAAFIRTMKPE